MGDTYFGLFLQLLFSLAIACGTFSLLVGSIVAVATGHWWVIPIALVSIAGLITLWVAAMERWN